ncbi:tetratricopeptide repeat protein [uncultured Ferrovibrio sp.]|jgi:tetratricopeptide (TPR) repeat protein|uniref:tetratricopeptide repeat protein n=1 Tax=uncultured Ferrovibrio sp. TaxID=1576913 RepID=UPI0026257C73|nr:tetratricopeptide repeat protein [uncultured Ferrovibrio sp.]
MMKDNRGDTVSGASREAVALFEQALSGFHCYHGNPFEPLDAAIAAAPDFAMAHAMRAHLFLSGTEAAGLAPAREAIDAARRCARTDREYLHVAAATALADGRYEEAAEKFEDILLAYPRDALALQMAHLFDFYRGDARNLRDRIVRVLPNWSADLPNYHAVLGMLAFGLEECGEYGKAEEAGRRACELNPKDAWAHHAVCHVMEMRGRVDEGIRWARDRMADWAPDNMMAVHNWWHLALYHLERDEIDTVLELYDQSIRGGKSTVVLDMIDASAMLWRLHLRGIEVGAARWAEIADAWAPLVQDGFYAFNDVHGLISFLGAGRKDLVEQQMASLQRSAIEGKGSNAAMAAQVGLPVAEALIAFAEGRYAQTISRLRPVRAIAHRFGGSHAQRDLLELTLIEAARRANDVALVRALAAERLRVKPASPLAQRYRFFAADKIAA